LTGFINCCGAFWVRADLSIYGAANDRFWFIAVVGWLGQWLGKVQAASWAGEALWEQVSGNVGSAVRAQGKRRGLKVLGLILCRFPICKIWAISFTDDGMEFPLIYCRSDCSFMGPPPG